MARPVCMRCGCEMECWKTGMYVVRNFDDSEKDNVIGVIYSGDAYKCCSCGSLIAVGFGRGMLMSEHPIRPEDVVLSIDGSYPSQNIPQ